MPCTSDVYTYYCHHHVVPIFPSYIHHYILFCIFLYAKWLYYYCQQSLTKARKKEQLHRTFCILKLRVSVFDVYLCNQTYTMQYVSTCVSGCIHQCVPVYLDVHQCVPVYLDVH